MIVTSAAEAIPLAGPSDSVARPGASDVTTELVNGARFEACVPDWEQLLAKVLTQNVFMDPAMVAAASLSFAEAPLLALLAWRSCDGVRRLVGAFSFSVGRPYHSLLPIRVINAPAYPQSYLASPVLDADHAEEVWRAFLDRMASEPQLPKIVALESAAADDRTMQALVDVLAARKAPPLTLESFRRPMLRSVADVKTYLAQAMSASTRKKLRQHRRALEKQGTLRSLKATSPEEIAPLLEDFLALESAGWKGRAGTALLSRPADAAFARKAVTALAAKGQATIYALQLDGQPLSMQIVLRNGDTAFTWKTAYDERFRDYSPGMLLFEDYTADLLADRSIACVDSCAHDEASYMAAWTERRRVVNVWIDVRHGASLQFRLLGALQRGYRTLRALAKEYYGGLRARGRLRREA